MAECVDGGSQIGNVFLERDASVPDIVAGAAPGDKGTETVSKTDIYKMRYSIG
jgi:hypothetical protein